MRRFRFPCDGAISVIFGNHVEGLQEITQSFENGLPGIIRLALEACLNVKHNAAGAAEGCRLIS